MHCGMQHVEAQQHMGCTREHSDKQSVLCPDAGLRCSSCSLNCHAVCVIARCAGRGMQVMTNCHLGSDALLAGQRKQDGSGDAHRSRFKTAHAATSGTASGHMCHADLLCMPKPPPPNLSCLTVSEVRLWRGMAPSPDSICLLGLCDLSPRAAPASRTASEATARQGHGSIVRQMLMINSAGTVQR